MWDSILGSSIDEIIGLNAQMFEVIRGATTSAQYLDFSWKQNLADSLLAQQESQAEYLRKIAGIPTQEAIAQATRSRAVEFLQPVFDSVNSVVPSTPGQQMLNQTLFVDALAGIGTAAIGVASSIERMNILSQTGRTLPDLISIGDVGGFMKPLPDFSQLAAEILRLQKIEDGQSTLEDHEFGFASVRLPLEFLIGIAQIAEPVRAAVVTTKMTALTKKDEFRQVLREEMLQSTFMARRWPIVEKALDAHCERNYFLSIPALLPQVEGSIADALILKGIVTVRNNKLYRKDPLTGKLKVGKDKKPIEIKGGKQLLQGNPLSNHPVLHQVTEVLASQFVNDKMFDLRNHILHGRKLNYNQANVSTRAIWLIHTIAPEIAAFEAGRI